MKHRDNTNNKYQQKREEAFDFLKISYTCYVLGQIQETERLLNEYIYWMNRGFNMYSGRITEPITNKHTSRNLSEHHIGNFERLVNEIQYHENNSDNQINKLNKSLVMNFYKELISFVDGAIGEKYYYGRPITRREHCQIKSLLSTKYPGGHMTCMYDWIIFYIDKRYIDSESIFLQKFKKRFSNMECKKIGGTWVLKYDNEHGSLCFGDIWDLLSMCNKNVLYFDVRDIKNEQDHLILEAVDEVGLYGC
jgi:hypothetical protein